MTYNGVEQDFTYQNKSGGRLVAWTMPTREHLYFGYSEYGVLAEIQHDSDPVQKFTTWLKDLNLTSSDRKDPANWYLKQDPDNTYTFGSKGRKQATLLADQITAVDGAGLTKTVTCNSMGGAIVENTGNGNTRTTTFYRAPGKSFDGKLKSVEANGVAVVSYAYDPVTGYLAAVTDNNAITTYFDYPANWKKDFKHPWDPKPIRVWRGSKDHPEVIAQYAYDDAGRVANAQDIAGQVTSYGYSPRGELTTVKAPDGVTSTVTYDAFGRCVQATNGSQSESVGYDEQGHVASRTASDGSRTEFTYDAMGNVTQVSRNGKLAIGYVRNASGQVTGMQDSLGRIRKIDNDSHGNLLADHAPDGSVTKYEYDRFNRRTAQIDGNGNRISFTYDPGSNLTKQVNALGDVINWTYDNQNHLVEKDNGVQKIQYTYDDNGRLASTDYGAADQKLACTYDDHGRVESMVTPATAFYYLYDQLGRVDAAREVQGTDEQLLRYQYNYAGERTGLILARYVPAIDSHDGKIGHDAKYEVLQQTNYEYDENRRLTAIESNGKPVIAYKYDAAGRPALKTYGNGIQSALSYDAGGRLARIVFTGGPIKTPLTLAYTWDSADQVVARTWDGETLRYEYDAAGRLAKVIKVIDARSSEILEAYEYDKAGNITKKTLGGQVTIMAYNAANELISTSSGGGSTNYTYDKAGRLISYTGGPTNTYGWLDKVVKATDAQGRAISMTYWPDGQLASEGQAGASAAISKAAFVPGQAAPQGERFLWDGLALLRRGDAIYIAEPHPSGGAIVASHRAGEPGEDTYYLNDLLGTTLAVVQGEAITFNHTTAFGQARPSAPASQPTPIQALVAVPPAASPAPSVLPVQTSTPTTR